MKSVITSIVISSAIAAVLADGFAGQPNVAKRHIKDDRPFFAVWNSHSTADSPIGPYDGPYLRFAFWEDGRVVFAKESEKEARPLRRGRIAAYRVARLKQALIDSGVFKLKGNCYLVPDAGRICMMVQVGADQQTLYWDEVKESTFRTELNPHSNHLKMIQCWEALNSLGLVACPDQFESTTEKVRPQETWYLMPGIQTD
jgi:hypothetical protein